MRTLACLVFGSLTIVLLAVLWTAPVIAAEAKVPLKLNLPDKRLSDTPSDYYSDHLKFTFKVREHFLAPPGTVNVAKGKPVTSSCTKPINGKIAFITDGKKHYKDEYLVELCKGPQWVQIDLKERFEIQAIVVWHFYKRERAYFDVIAQVSDDPAFPKDAVKTLFNNDHDNSSKLGLGKSHEYFENNEGLLIDAKRVDAHYVRLSSNGNCDTNFNHYIEIEIYGVPSQIERGEVAADESPAEAQDSRADASQKPPATKMVPLKVKLPERGYS